MDWDEELVAIIKKHAEKHQVSALELLIFVSRLVALAVPDHFDEEDLRDVCRHIYSICVSAIQMRKGLK